MDTAIHEQRSRTVEERLRLLGSHIDDLLRRVSEKRGIFRDSLEKKVEDLTTRIDDDIARLEARIGVANARMEQDGARTLEDFEEAVEEELIAWRARLADLQVQVSLGRMDLRDAVESSRDALERIEASVSDRLDWLRRTRGDPWPGPRDEIRQSMEELAEQIP